MSAKLKHSFYVVDLVRNKPKTRFIQIPAYRVDVDMVISTKKKGQIPKTKLDRLTEVGTAKLVAIENDIRQMAMDGEKEAVSLMGVPSKKSIKAVDDKIKEINARILKKIEGAQKAAEKAIEAEIKKEKNRDSLLFEAKVAFTWRISKSFIKIGASIAKLVSTSGADVSSYITIATEVWNLGKELQKLLETDKKKRDLLTAAIAAHDAGKIGKDVVLKARANYRNHTTKTRQKTDKISIRAEALFKKAKAEKNFKDSLKLAAVAMEAKKRASALAASFKEREAFLETMTQEIETAGVTVSDVTTWKKIRNLDADTILKQANEVATYIKAAKELADNIKDLAA